MQQITAFFVLVVATLQPQSAWALSPLSVGDTVWTQSVTSTSLIQAMEQYFRDGLNSLKRKSVCEHINDVLAPLASRGKIHLSKSGPPRPDESLLNNAKFWGVASVQWAPYYHDRLLNAEHRLHYPKTDLPPTHDRRKGNVPLSEAWSLGFEEYQRTHPQGTEFDQYLDIEGARTYDYYGLQKRYVDTQQDKRFFVLADESATISFTEVVFPGLSTSIPHSKLLNMSLNCANGQLDVHAELSGGLEVIPQVLRFGNVIMSLRVKIGSKVTFDRLILSANTQLFGESTFVAVKYDFTLHTFSIPPSLVLSVKQLADHIPTLKTTLSNLPGVAAEILDSSIRAFNYKPQTKELTIHSTASEVFVVPKVVKLTHVKFSLNVIIASSPSVKSLSFSGMWKVGTIDFVTHLKYNGPKQLFHVTSTSSNGTQLSAKDLVQKIAGFSYSLPTTLVSFTLKEIVGNIYSSGKYFIAMQGVVLNGKLYVLLYKGSDGLKLAVTASIRNFRFSDVVRSDTDIDISNVPYFGRLVISSMALSIASGPIRSPTLPYIFGSRSPLLLYGDTLPAGVTALFKLNIANVNDATANYKQGILLVTIPDSQKLSLKSLFGEVPGLQNALSSVPSQVSSILEAKITSFQYNSTAKQLSMTGFLQDFTVLTDFISLSNVRISFVGSIGNKIATESLDFRGQWKIGNYAIQTVVMYDGILKRLSISSHSQGVELNIEKFLEGVAGTDLVLPPAISSFTFTSMSGRITERMTVVVFNGIVKSKGVISIVAAKTSSGVEVALAAKVTAFKLSDLVKSAMGVDVSNVPFLRSMVISELTFSAASDTIKTPLLTELVSKGSAVEKFKDGLFKGISGKFVTEISGVRGIAVDFVHKHLSFRVPDATSLSLDTLLSNFPRVKSAIDKLPPKMMSILKVKVQSFGYNPDSKELQYSGTIDNTVELIPQFISLTSVKVSLTVVVSSKISISELHFTGSWVLHKLPIHTTVSYNQEEKRLDILGELDKAKGGVSIKTFIMSLSGQTLPIPSIVASSVTLRKLSGNMIGDTTLISLSGTAGSAEIYIIYQKSKTGASIALAVEVQKFRFASLVSSATGVDISSFPFFGSLVIPKVGFTISSDSINNPLLSGIYRSDSFLDNFGDQLTKGVSASFRINLGTAKGIMAEFANNELELTVPDSVILSLNNVLKLIPGVKNVLRHLPSALQDVTNTRLHKIYYVPSSRTLQFSGTLKSLRIIPTIISLTDIKFEFSGVIGHKTRVNYARFKGNWNLKSLSLTTEVTYRKMLLLEAYPTSYRSMNVQDFLKGLTGTKINIPSALNTLKFTQVTGKVDKGVLSVVLIGKIVSLAKVGVVFQKTAKHTIVSFAADVKAFKLAELIKVGMGVDISRVPFFGDLTIPALSFVISSGMLSTDTLPDMTIPGIPKELLLESIPKGLKGQFLLRIGSAVGLTADFSDGVLTIKVPSLVSLSLRTLISAIPQVKSTIDSLPSAVRDILSAKITKLVFKPLTKDLSVSLYLSRLTIVPKVIALHEVQLSIDLSMETSHTQSEKLVGQNYMSPYAVSFLYETPAEMETEETAVVQAVTINAFRIKATWLIRSIAIQTEVTYARDGNKLNFVGTPIGSRGLSITDVIKGLAGRDLKIPSVLSSLKLTKVVAQTAEYGTIVIITARAGSAEVYVVFDILKSGTNIAVAADIEEFKLADLIKTATSVDVSSVPFIGSFIIPTMAFCVSTDTIYSNLFASTFQSDSPLLEYDRSLPKGLTAYFKIDIGRYRGIEVTYAKGLLDFNVPPASGLTLKALLSEIPGIDRATDSLPSPISDLLASRLTAIRFDKTTITLTVAGSVAQINVIPNIMLVRNLDISVVARLGSKNRGLEALAFSGDWVLRNINIRVKVSYDRAARKVLFAAIPKEGLSIRDLISGLTGTSLPIPTVINSVKLTGIIGERVADVFTFIFSGSIAGKANVHLVFHTFGATKNIAIAVGIKSFKLADLVKAATSIDIHGIPFFGRFSVPSMAFTIAKTELSTPLLSRVIDEGSLLAKYGGELPSGFTAEFQLPIGKVQGIVGSYRNKILSFRVPDDVDLSLRALVSQIPGIDIQSLALPPVIGDILRIRLRGFSFDVAQKIMSVQIYINKITFFDNLLSITKTTLKLIAKLSNPRMLSAEIDGMVSIGDTDLAVDLRRDPKSKIYVVTIRSENLPIFGIVKQIGAAMLPADLNTLLGQVFNFNILNAKIVYPFGAVPQHILISGAPMWGIKTVHMTAVAIKYGGKMRLIQKYSFGEFNIAEFIKKLTGISLYKIVFLNQRVDISFIVSSTAIKHNIIKTPEFNGMTINKGLSFKLPLGFPPNCECDPLCAVAKKLFGNVRLTLEATITNSKSYTFTASIGNLRLGSGVILQRAGLQIQAGSSVSIGIAGSIKLNRPDITLNAAIRATESGVKLEGSMSGCWYNAFGSQYLTICNILLSVTIVPAPSPITRLEFGGRIKLGKRSCGKVFTAEGYVGVNVVNPNENYFYAKIGRITFKTFFDAFCVGVSLPRPLTDSGFPDGIQASFSLLGKELPHARISIPAGYRFKGTINILGLRAYAEIGIHLPKGILMKAGLPPVKIAGLFKMYASRSDRSRGPFLHVEISTSKVHMEARGFVEILGISAETKLLITRSKYEFSIKGKFLNRFYVSLRVHAPYYGNLANANFQVEGWFKNDLFDRISRSVRDGLKRSADEAVRHINAAINKIREKQAVFNDADRSLVNAQRKVNNAKRAFDHAIAKLEHARRRARNVCHIRTCGSWCVGCPRGWHCCGTVLGGCVCKRPGWHSCCSRVTDIACTVANADCWVRKKAVDLALRAASWVVYKSRDALDIAKGALNVARGIVYGAKHSLGIANGFLEAVRVTYRIGVQAISAVDNFVQTQIINIRETYFKTGLSTANGGGFVCRVKGVLMGRNIDVNLKVDTRNVRSVARSLGENAISGLSKFIG